MSGAGWQKRGARALLTNAQSVKAMAEGMARSKSVPFDQLEALQGTSGALRDIFEPHLHGNVSLEPGLRAAMISLSRELIAANTVLSSTLASPRPAPRQGSEIDAMLGRMAAVSLEFLVATLLLILEHAHGHASYEGNFTYLVVSSGVAILDSAALALSASGVEPRLLDSHTQYLQRLLRAVAALSSESMFRALRATACSPSAIMTCLRLLFAESQGDAGGPDCGRLGTAQIVLCQSSALDAERAAIRDDAGLQERILRRAEAALKALRTAAGSQGSAASPPVEAYMAAASGVFLIGALPGAVQRAARGSPQFAEEVMAGAERLLWLGPPLEAGQPRQQQVLCSAVYALQGISLPLAERGGRAPGFGAALRCLALALALVDRIRRAEGEDSQLLASAASGLHSILDSLITAYELHSEGHFPRCEASLSDQHRALEGMLRLAALLPPSLPEKSACPHGANTAPPLSDCIFDKLRVVFNALWCTLITSEVNGQKPWSVFAELASSAAKLALRLAEAGSSDKQMDCLSSCMSDVGLVFELLYKKSEGFSKRQWQGVVLAFWGSAASFAASGYARGIAAVFLPMSYVMKMPWARDLALATPAGRSTVLRVYEGVLAWGGQSDAYERQMWTHIYPRHPIHAAAWDKEVALALARCGVLSLLVGWAAENCSLPQVPTEGVELRKKLTFTLNAVLSTSSAPASQEVRDVMVDVRFDKFDGLCIPAFWERLRAEMVEPLVLELEAEDAAEEGGAARQAQLAVDAAEALATRPCAHACCTTIVGACEADAPRGKLCSGCRVVRYCGAACQKADWQAHKAACREVVRRRGGAAA